MKTTSVTPADLTRSVISVPPLARTAAYELAEQANRQLLRTLRDGGVSTAMYGGNANLYNISYPQYERLLADLVAWAPEDMWVIPSIGPSYGQMLDHLDILTQHAYPTAMVLPLQTPATPAGTATGIRRAVERFGKPMIVYLKWESYLTPALVADLVADGLVCALKYAIVREDPAVDSYLTDLLDRVDSSVIISGIGERPAITHWRDFGLRSYTSGSVCIAPRQSTRLLEALKAGHFEEAEALRQLFLPFEDLRDGINPIRVLHEGVAAAGISDTGPLLPLLSGLESDDHARVAEAARVLAGSERVDA
jgi:dihydrodipicolinate synthase/N-acetylneuraminate lyase